MRFSYDPRQGGWVQDMHGDSPSIQHTVLQQGGGTVFPFERPRPGEPYQVSGINGRGQPGCQTAAELKTLYDRRGLPYLVSEDLMGNRGPTRTLLARKFGDVPRVWEAPTRHRPGPGWGAPCGDRPRCGSAF